MWSGNPQQPGGPYTTQWALNPAAYANMPNEQVDWASLAQQWIKMKETIPEGGAVVPEGESNPINPTLVAPAAPIISGDDSNSGGASWPSLREESWWSGSMAGGASAWDSGGTGWGWQESAAVPPSNAAPNYPSAAFSDTSNSSYPSAPSHYQPPPPSSSNHYNNSNQSYWSGEGGAGGGGGGGGGGKEWSSGRRGRGSHSHHDHQTPPVPQPPPPPDIDAVKRKQLPAWIREGLEKMEREKAKKAEHERMVKQREERLAAVKEDVLKIGVNGLPSIKTKFDSEDSENEIEVEKESRPLSRPAEKVMGRLESPGRLSPSRTSSPPPPPPTTKEEIFQSVMIGVRRILTELLMEVTGEEIKKTVEQFTRKYKRKAPATTVHKTMALTSLRGKLGLAIYGSDSEEESKSSSEEDSDAEVKNRIKKRQEEFEDKAAEIEREIEEQEEREKRILLDNSGAVSGAGAEDRESSEEQVSPQVPLENQGKSISEEEDKAIEKKSDDRERKGSSRQRDRDDRSRGNHRRRRRGSSRSSESTSSESSSESSGSERRRRRHRHHSRRERSRSRSHRSHRHKKSRHSRRHRSSSGDSRHSRSHRSRSHSSRRHRR